MIFELSIPRKAQLERYGGDTSKSCRNRSQEQRPAPVNNPCFEGSPSKSASRLSALHRRLSFTHIFALQKVIFFLPTSRRGLRIFLVAVSICFFESAWYRFSDAGLQFAAPENPEFNLGSNLWSDDHGNITKKNELPPCKILVANHRVSYHLEVLESILALFPSSSLPLPSTCNHDFLVFDFAISKRPGCDSWRNYFVEEMLHKTYNGTHAGERRMPGQARFARSKDIGYIDTIRAKHHATIEASCYCNDEFMNIMGSRNDTACIFHERCDRMIDNERAFWLSPHHPRYIFPSVLPPPSSPRLSFPTLPLKLCAIGSTSRRNFHLLQHFLQSLDTVEARKLFRINLLGKGQFPPLLRDYKDITTQSRIKDFVKFQHTVAAECDIMLPLVNKKSHHKGYFNDDSRAYVKKLSGSIVQAVAYDIPMVIHQDLAELYQKEHGMALWETHADDPTSFALALERLVKSIANVTFNIDISSALDRADMEGWGPSALDSMWND